MEVGHANWDIGRSTLAKICVKNPEQALCAIARDHLDTLFGAEGLGLSIHGLKEARACSVELASSLSIGPEQSLREKREDYPRIGRQGRR